jgi:hypothetical protein
MFDLFKVSFILGYRTHRPMVKRVIEKSYQSINRLELVISPNKCCSRLLRENDSLLCLTPGPSEVQTIQTREILQLKLLPKTFKICIK